MRVGSDDQPGGRSVGIIDLALYRRIVEECFPTLEVSSIRFIGGGTYRVFEVNGELIFRFPHGFDGEEMLRKEQRTTAYLSSHLSLPIPRYEYFSAGCSLFPRAVAGYRKLAGITLEQFVPARPALSSIAAQIGTFLGELHGLPAEAVQEMGAPPFDPTQARQRQCALLDEIRRYAFARLDAAQQAWTEALFQPFLADDGNWQFGPVLIHGDLDSTNILYDPAEGRVAGVIDFEDTGLGDPVWDFCALAAEFGTAFVHDMLASYGLPPDERFERRLAFHSRRVLFHEMLYGIEYDAPDCTSHAVQRLGRAMAGREPIGGWLVGSTSQTRQQEGFPT